MSSTTLETPIGQLAAHRPDALPILERWGLDYCCGGERTIEDACREANVDPQMLIGEVEDSPPRQPSTATDWTTARLTDLCDHIERTHHAFLREQLPFLTDLIKKVLAAHGENHPELHDVARTFAALRAELEPHMLKEEQILFPAVRALEAASSAIAFPFDTVQNPIRMMEHEHDNAGGALRELRRLTDGYRVPEDACNAYRGLYESLRRLETDLHEHIHKENNILFPRAIRLEGRDS